MTRTDFLARPKSLDTKVVLVQTDEAVFTLEELKSVDHCFKRTPNKDGDENS